MGKVTKSYYSPAGSIILKGFGDYDYCDSFSTGLNSNESIDKITLKVFKVPDWVIFLMRLRNIIVSVFGLKTGNKKDLNESGYYPVGSKAGYFTVTDRNENEIVMYENDKHLQFRTSVMKGIKDDKIFVNLTTIVKYNNAGGRIYFFFVKPFHQIIMRALLKRLI